MFRELKPLLLILILIMTVAAGVFLKYFRLDTFIIIAGFRFHLSSLVPFLLLIKFIPWNAVKTMFTSPRYKQNLIPVLWLLIPPLFTGAAYVTGFISLTDPEYFYEFGLSSVIDYPVYLIWNFINTAALFIVLHFFGRNVIVVTLAVLFLFCYEFIPVEGEEINIISLAGFLIYAAGLSLLYVRFNNIYWFTITTFTTLWGVVLLFGSSSETLINLLFAARFNEWEGFFSGSRTVNEYLAPVYLLIFVGTLAITALLKQHQESRL